MKSLTSMIDTKSEAFSDDINQVIIAQTEVAEKDSEHSGSK